MNSTFKTNRQMESRGMEGQEFLLFYVENEDLPQGNWQHEGRRIYLKTNV